MLKNSISNPSLGLSVEIQSWFSSQFVLIEYINKYLTASFYKRIFSTWQTRYTYAWKQYFMRSNNTNNILHYVCTQEQYFKTAWEITRKYKVMNLFKNNMRTCIIVICILL